MYILLSVLLSIVSVLIQVAFSTLAERKILAAIQRRRGPNYNGIFGILQPLIDGLKLVTNTISMPRYVNTLSFFLGPILLFLTSLIL